MKAQDVMVRNVITVRPDTSVAEAVKLLGEHDISALPVVDSDNHLVGILSEADLLRRGDLDHRQHPWWIETLMPAAMLAVRGETTRTLIIHLPQGSFQMRGSNAILLWSVGSMTVLDCIAIDICGVTRSMSA